MADSSHDATGDSGEAEKGSSLASRLLSKKASRRTDKLTFGSNAQVRQSSLDHL